MWRSTLALAIAFGTGGPAVAEGPTVRDMLPYCEGGLSGQQSWMVGFCVGTVSGVSAILTVNCVTDAPSMPPHLKMEPGPTNEAKLQAFVNWARANPDNWDYDFATGVVAALSGVWPCQK